MKIKVIQGCEKLKHYFRENIVRLDGGFDDLYYYHKDGQWYYTKSLDNDMIVLSFEDYGLRLIQHNCEYWKQRCEAAEEFIQLSPCDPNITGYQNMAYQKWMELKNQSI